MKITFRHLEILREVAQTGNFTKAAQRLYITQSAVSHAIRELEEHAGTLLFDRLSKSVQLTKSGEILLEECLPILSSCEALEAHMRNLESRAPISIVSSITIATFFLPNILEQFKKEWPDIPVRVNVVSAVKAMEILRDGEADFALVEGAEPQESYRYHAFASCDLLMSDGRIMS